MPKNISEKADFFNVKLSTVVTPGLLQKKSQKSVTVREFVTVREQSVDI